MRILVHDYSGHPFQVQLSRVLAARGHTVLHLFSASFQTPKGNLSRQPTDVDRFAVRGLDLGQPFRKHSFIRRRRQEQQFGRLVAAEVTRFRPDVVLSSNAPLDTQHHIMSAAKRCGARFVFWLQDIYSEAISRVLSRKIPLLGGLIGKWYRQLEFSMLQRSDHVITITADFVPMLKQQHIDANRISVIENWAPLDEMPPHDRDNDWAAEHMRTNGLRVVYSGTIGYKHDPSILLDAAQAIDGTVYVFSEGPAADRLAADAKNRGIDNLDVRPWVEFADLPKMLSGADILLAMIEADAGTYSVPSKVLSYFCAGRPVLAAIPKGNLARQLIEREGTGAVVSPGDRAGFLTSLRAQHADPQQRLRQGKNGRAYAERSFDIERITDRFERILTNLPRELERA